ncbi:MAG: hypothetical protein U1F33_07015 [Alphaproteobacteria bacterium]
MLPALILSAAISACAPAHTSETADHFADAGIAYTEAVPAVIDESFQLSVSVDSLQLQQAKPDIDRAARGARLKESDRLLEARLKILRDLKRHVALLRSYFGALKSLSASDATPGLVGTTNSLVDRMAELKPAIADASFAGRPVKSLVNPAVTLAVGAYQNAALRDELTSHGAAVERELDLERAALTAIGQQMTADLDLLVQIRERNPITEAYLRDGPLPSDWSARRMAAFQTTIRSDNLDAARKAAATLHDSWVAFAEGRLGEGGVTLLLRDVASLKALVDELAPKRAP